MKRQILIAIAAALPLIAGEVPPDSRTYALVIGISKYQKLPKDLWLQYPEADARAFSELLGSPRGGAVPAGQRLLLANEEATTAQVRRAF